MNRTRNLGGFSLVEMMLLLIIVSLMIASGVSVISKKHVKVPRLAMHGAYICYYNKEGKLHEEKYVGAGLSRRIWNEDVEVCRFIPPEKASYFYVQAVAGGGAGGAANYTSQRVTHESEVEVIPPFGVTSGWLELKGIGEDEFSGGDGGYGGTLWAYGRGDGNYGDAGDGGDIYYIKQVGGQCFAEEKWTNTTDGRECKSDGTSYLCYDNYKIDYDYKYTTSCYTSWGSWCEASDDFSCTSYKKEWCHGSKDDPCPEPCWSSSYRYTIEDDPDTEDIDESGTYCTYSRVETDECERGTYTAYSSSSCTYYVDKPIGATCSGVSSDVSVTNEMEIQPQSGSTLPHIVLLQSEGSMKGQHPTDDGDKDTIDDTSPKADCENDDATLRKIILPDQDSYTICNYGNAGNYLGSKGIMGSCFVGFDCAVDCSPDSLKTAYGGYVDIYGGGDTAINKFKEVVADKTYFPDSERTINGVQYDKCGIVYDKSGDPDNENKGPGQGAYGEWCQTGNTSCIQGATSDPDAPGVLTDADFEYKVAEPDYDPHVENGSYQNPISGKIYNTTKNIVTRCNGALSGDGAYNSTELHFKTTDCDWVYSDSDITWYSNPYRTSRPCANYDNSFTCVEKEYKDVTTCMYGTSDLDADHRYAYVIGVAAGEDGGVGHRCAFSATGSTDLEYQGRASIVPGINGSDRNIAGKYKAIFEDHGPDLWGPWTTQSDSWAETGTDSSGMVYVKLGGPDCTINETPPTAGKGACVRNNGGRPVGYPGSDYTNCEYSGDHPVDGSFSGAGEGVDPPDGCSNGGHVGYCLIHKDGTIQNFGKYTYSYSWTTNHLTYGNGGEPGEYRSMVIRSFKDRDMIVIPGLGGIGGGCTGNSGQDTLVYTVPKDMTVEADDTASLNGDSEVDLNGDSDIDAELLLKVKGGSGGQGCISTPDEQLPHAFTDIPSKSVGGGAGKSPNFNAKSNIMGLVLPLDDSNLGKWLSYSGSSGHGGGSYNNCWTSTFKRFFEGEQLKGVVGYWDDDMGDIKCLGDYGSTPPGDGIPGAVLIKW